MANTTALAPASAISWRQYLELCKPNVVLLIVFTAIVGMLLSSPGMVPLDTLFFASLGIGMAAASGAAINHWVDQKIDATMERTKGRPIPTGGLSSKAALSFALSLCVLSMAILLATTNQLTALLTFICVIGYAVIYTMFLKRSTPHNIVWGGAAGAAPPILGWVAMTGEVNTEALLLFLIIFIWTPPHFWALAIRRRDDYAKVDVPMLPVTHGIPFTKVQVLLYTCMLLAVTLIPFAIQMTGLIYLAGAVALGLGFIYHAYKLYRCSADQHAMKTFAYSIFYLTALFAFLLVDHYIRLVIRG
ncbi:MULTISPECIES: heme o synthase [unclassified Oleiphilus]|jgi:protoheme IX farnesyltransferase|nr:MULTISPECIES: heme o synthase [unclassified Oleiphilus]KZY43376.1 protoheme IX farnesyltransferase [Oleiphilus sp. HI0050]KZY80764.1 protoheme IX farnesyltransferase [Oleiphilus sp. HI0069]KZY89970.1 protoheme IX farnesyltransferase [Oleiphilus sp. HI0072]KZZ20748.1 protoheme IX farnesyltransferase [Oleiphilus sp. HI0078]KZZ27189.1 protoheme IX farnesyltransferase [Oleiphilus sp. HI0081]